MYANSFKYFFRKFINWERKCNFKSTLETWQTLVGFLEQFSILNNVYFFYIITLKVCKGIHNYIEL